MSAEVEQKVLACLRKSAPKDMSIEELAEATKLHRNTVSKYVAILEAGRKIIMTRTLGNAKMFKLKEA